MSSLPIVIADPVPLYRRGLTSAFVEAGFAPEEPNDLEGWARQEGPRVLLLTTTLPEDGSVVRHFTEANHGLIVVALLREPSLEMYVAAMQSGASGAAPWMADPATVVSVVQAASDQHWLVPAEVARRMAGRISLPPEARGLSSSEVQWLQMMASGMKVVELARELQYSEREMFRLLHDLYQRMGVRSRTEALVKAAQWGLIPVNLA